MAGKAAGRQAGRSRPQGQERQRQKQSSPQGRGAANGAAGRKQRDGGGSARGREQRGGRSQREESSQQGEQGSPGAGAKVADTVKQHPLTAAAVGAGLTLLAAQGLRMVVGGNSAHQDEASDQDSPEGASSRGDEGEQDDQDAEASDSPEADVGDEGEEDEGGGMTGRLRQGASRVGSALRSSGDAMRRGARSGFERGRQAADQNWNAHPLVMCGVALVVGAAAGLLLPSTRQEDQLMGEASDKLTERVKSAGQSFFRQTRSVAGRAIQEAVDTTGKELEREGLSPDRIGKKMKRIVGHVRSAVSDAVNE